MRSILQRIGLFIWHRLFKRQDCPDHTRYSEALKLLTRRRFKDAEKILKSLAGHGYTRAQFELGQMYTQGKGVPKIDGTAEKWFRRAAEAHHRPAQYALALMLIDARATVQARGEEFEWLTKAAEGGHPEAAMTLAHRYLHHPPAEMDNDEAKARAIAWYHRAGERYLRARRRDDALTVLRIIEGLDKEHELARGLADQLG